MAFGCQTHRPTTDTCRYCTWPPPTPWSSVPFEAMTDPQSITKLSAIYSDTRRNWICLSQTYHRTTSYPQWKQPTLAHTAPSRSLLILSRLIHLPNRLLSSICKANILCALLGTPIRVTFPANLVIPAIIIIPSNFANDTNYEETHYDISPHSCYHPSLTTRVLNLIIRIPLARWARTLPLGIRYQQSLWMSIGCTVERERGTAGSLAHRRRQ